MRINDIQDLELKEALQRVGYREDYDLNDSVKKQETVEYKGKKYLISTIDLGFNHNYFGIKPLYYETMIFIDGEGAIFQTRYSTLEEALRGHEKVKLLLLNDKLKEFDE